MRIKWIHSRKILRTLPGTLQVPNKSCLFLLPLYSKHLAPTRQFVKGMNGTVVMVSFMSTWLGYRISRYLFKQYFWVCLWGYFQKKLAFESIDWVKPIILPNASGHHPIWRGPGWGKGRRRDAFAVSLNVWAGTVVFCTQFWTDTIDSPDSWAFGFGLDMHHQLSWFFSWLGTSQPPQFHNEPTPYKHHLSVYLGVPW